MSEKPKFSNKETSLIDPYTQTNAVSYERFIRWYSKENHISATTEDLYNSLHGTYNNYKQDLYARTARSFVESHCDEAWFEDSYWVDESQGRVLEVSENEKSYRRALYDKFMDRLDAGYYDDFQLPTAEDVIEKPSIPDNDTDDSIVPSNDPQLSKWNQDSRNDAMENTLLVSHVLPNISVAQIHNALDGISFVQHFSLSTINLIKNDERSLWVHFKAGTNMDGAKEAVDGIQLDSNFTIESENPKIPTHTHPIPIFEIASSEQTCKNLLEKLIRFIDRASTKYSLPNDAAQRIEDRLKTHASMKDDDDKPTNFHDIRLSDLYAEYLRQVATFDFWTSKEYESLIALLQDSPAGYSRKKFNPSKEVGQEENIWLSDLENNFACLLEPENVDIKAKGALPVEDFINNELDSVIMKEDEQKYRCHVGTCTKLFLGPEFVRKHINKKHKDWLDHIKKVAICLYGYVLDPCRAMDPKVVSTSYVSLQILNKPYVGFRNINTNYTFPTTSYSRRNDEEITSGASSQKSYSRQEPMIHRREFYRTYQDLDAPNQEVPELDY